MALSNKFWEYDEIDQKDFDRMKDFFDNGLYYDKQRKYIEECNHPVSDAFFGKDSGYKIQRFETSYKEDENGNLTFVAQRCYWL